MPISINGTGSITGLSAGGLPDASIVTADIADSAVTTGKLAQPLTLATAQNSTSGTAIDFTGIPSWAKRITVMFNNISTNGGSVVQIQFGTTSGFTTSGYTGVTDSQATGGGTTASFTSGLAIARSGFSSAAAIYNGIANICNVSGNTWIGTFLGSITNAGTGITWGATQNSLSGTLNSIRITTVNGTDTFDAGSINIMYEG